MPALGPWEPEVQFVATPAMDHPSSGAESANQTSKSDEQTTMDLLDSFDGLSVTSNCGSSDHKTAGGCAPGCSHIHKEALEVYRAPKEAQEKFAREVVIPSPAASPPPKTPPPIDEDCQEPPLIVGIDCFVETLDDYYGSGAPVDEGMMPELMELLGGYED